MKRSLTNLASDTAIYGISSILGRMLNYLLVPLYTAYLSTGAYGIVTELYAYSAFLVILYTYGMETAFFRFTSKHPEDSHEIFNTATTAIAFTSITFSAVLVLFAAPIVNYLEYPGHEQYVYWFAAILAIDAFLAIPFARLRYQRKAWRFAMAKVFNIGVNVGLNLFFIIACYQSVTTNNFTFLEDWIRPFFNPDHLVVYVFVSNAIASLATLLFLLPNLKGYQPRLKKQWLKPMLKYGIPLLLMGIAGTTNEMFSRLLLKKLLPEGFYTNFTNQEALGIFGACYKLSIFMTLAVQAYKYAAEPFFFTSSAENENLKIYRNAMHGFVVFGSLMFLMVSLNLEWIAPIFLRSPDYLTGLEVVPVLLLANLFLGIYFNLSIWYKLKDKTLIGTWLAIGGALLTVAVNYSLIPLMGYMGSAWATLLVYASMSVVCYFLGKKAFPVPYWVGKGLLYIAISSLLVYILRDVLNDQYALKKVTQGLVILVFIVLAYLLDIRQLIGRKA